MKTSRNSMLRLALGACASVLAVTAPISIPGSNMAASAAPSRSGVLVLSIGESRVVNLGARMSNVVIANPEVADVYVRSQTQLYIQAKGKGETSFFVTGANGKTLYSATLRVGNNLSTVDQMLRMAMPEANITVSHLNGLTLLTGTIKSPEDAAEAERLVQAFVGKDVTVVSHLRTATPLQVNLQVKISEVSRDLLHKIGTNLATADQSSGFKFGIGQGRSFINQKWTPTGPLGVGNGLVPPTGGSAIGTIANTATLAADTKLAGLNILTALDLAENAGLATTLAQPNLTSLSGETASFLAGGEYPYTVSNGLEGNSIEFKQYGVQLAFTPTVLADGRISLRVRPAVSSLDFSVNGTVPALKTRSAETTVELGSGQAFMIAGLLSSETANNVNKVPGIGNIPVLGSLFKSRSFQRNETELVIVVTPYLVRPVNASDVRLPTDAFRSATEGQGLFLQQSSDGISGAPRNGPRAETGVVPPPQSSASPDGNSDAAEQLAARPQAADRRTRRDSERKARKQTASNSANPGFTF